MLGLFSEETRASSRRVGWTTRGSLVRLAMIGVPPIVLIGVLTRPMLFESSFNPNGLNALWFIWHQSLAIRANGAPSLFLDYSGAVFYPLYAFYGGTIYALTGALSLALGNAPLQAYVLTYVAGFAAAYGGWYWTARTVGVGRWLANVPGLVFVTSAYYLTLIYARGDWAEFLGVSTIPLMIAGGVALLRSDRPRARPAVALASSSIVFFGSHNITILWGSTMLVLVGLIVVACVPQARRQIRRRGLICVAAVLGAALLVNAWFLLPTVAYESHTTIGATSLNAQLLLRQTMPLVSSEHLFTWSRASASTPGALFALSLPILVIVWLLCSVVVLLWTGSRGMWMRILLILSGTTAVVIVVMTHAGLILALPRPYTLLQFSYRLESYVLLGLSGAALAVLALIRRGARSPSWWAWTLVPVLVVAVVGAVQQVGAYPGGEDAKLALGSYDSPPPALEGQHDYDDVSLPLLRAGNLPSLEVPPAAIHRDRASVTAHVGPGQLMYTNISGGPDLVQIKGARVAGVDERGHIVLAVGPGNAQASAASAQPIATEAITVSPAESLPVVLGRVLSLIGVGALVLGLAGLSLHRARAGRT
jgi:hypothetical protein